MLLILSLLFLFWRKSGITKYDDDDDEDDDDDDDDGNIFELPSLKPFCFSLTLVRVDSIWARLLNQVLYIYCSLPEGMVLQLLYRTLLGDILSSNIVMSRDSSDGIATGYGLDDQVIGVRFPTGDGNFSLHHRVQTGSGAHPASYPMGNGVSSPGVKRPGREADHSPPSNVKLYPNSPNTSSRCSA
jgi:hypothetical protein